MDLLDRERLSNGDYFLYFGVFVLVAWPTIMVLGLLDSFLIDNPEDNLTQYNFIAGIAAGAVGALTLAAVRRRKALATGPPGGGYRPPAKKKSSELNCPNCGYDGPPIADVQGKLICAMCNHQIAQEASRFRPVQLEAFAGPDPVPNASEGEWFYSREGRPLQPASFEKLTRLVAAGKLKPTDLVWKEGMASWKRIVDLPGLFPAVEPQPAPGVGGAGKGAGKKRSRQASQSWLHSLAAVPHLTSPVSAKSRSTDDEWYYIAGQEAMPHGPVTFVELCRRAAGGQVQPNDLVLGQGSEWKEARFVANLFRKGRA